jgi:hypothetical protein
MALSVVIDGNLSADLLPVQWKAQMAAPHFGVGTPQQPDSYPPITQGLKAPPLDIAERQKVEGTLYWKGLTDCVCSCV